METKSRENFEKLDGDEAGRLIVALLEKLAFHSLAYQGKLVSLLNEKATTRELCSTTSVLAASAITQKDLLIALNHVYQGKLSRDDRLRCGL